MTLVTALLAPLLAAQAGFGAGDGGEPLLAAGAPPGYAASLDADVGDPGGLPPLASVWERWRDDSADQVRIERHIIVRIPLGPPPFAPRPMFAFPRPDPTPRLIERKMGDCVEAAAIAGLTIDGDRRLILTMRDNDMVGVTLERACRVRDFYSGFYFTRQPDGKLCVGRDTLLSRNGSACRLSRVRRLVLVGR